MHLDYTVGKQRCLPGQLNEIELYGSVKCAPDYIVGRQRFPLGQLNQPELDDSVKHVGLYDRSSKLSTWTT